MARSGVVSMLPSVNTSMARQQRLRPSVESVEYNSQRDNMVISEYGRNVQKMVQQALQVQDREKRTQLANTIVQVMAYLNPHLRETADYKHKLWDHLHMISGYQLDVDSPYPMPEPATVRSRPKPVAYPASDIEYKYYGKILEEMIRQISVMEEGAKKEQLARYLANYMKLSYITWNKDTVEDDTILTHLQELSGAKLKLAESDRLSHTSEVLAMGKEKMRENSTKIVKKKFKKRKK